jgi:hypothetical protein
MLFASLSRRTIAQAVAGGCLALALLAIPVGASVASGTTSAAITNISVRPDSANTCSGAVCIFVTGSGLNVSDWTTTASLTKTMCTTASFLVNNVLYAQGVNTCGTNGDELASDWSDPGNFPNGTILCNTWTGLPGRACATVHS